MALLIDTVTEYVSHGSDSSLDNLSAWTAYLLWRTPSTMVGFQQIVSKTDASTKFIDYIQTGGLSGNTAKIAAGVRGASAPHLFYATTAYPLIPDTDIFVVVACDYAGSNDDRIRFYYSYRGGVLLTSTLATSDEPAGARLDDNTGVVRLGDTLVTANVPHLGTYSWFALYNGRHTENQIKAQLRTLYRPVFTGCRLFVHYGLFGATAYDWSGFNNHGTISGATFAPHASIKLFPFRISIPWKNPAVSTSDSISGFFSSDIAGQHLLPDGDITTLGDWRNELNGTTLYSSIDEYPLPVTSDYAHLLGAQVGDYFEGTFQNPTLTPGSGEVIIHWYAGDLNITGKVSLTVELLEGTTVIATPPEQVLPSGASFSYTLTTEEKLSISDWNNLRYKARIIEVL